MAPEIVALISTMQKAPNYVLPVSDFDFGWSLFFAGKPEAACRNAQQVDGYYAAWGRGAALLADERFIAEMHPEPAIEDDYAWIRTGC